MHDNNNILKKFVKNLNDEMLVIGEKDFSTELKKIENCINSADTRKTRKNADCAKCLNDLLSENCPTEEQKMAIARIKHKDFDQKTAIEQNELMAEIRAFPAIKGIFKVRFRSYKSGLKSLLCAKPIIQQAALISSPNRELVDSGDLSWDLVASLYSVFSMVSEKTDTFESLTATSGHQLQSYFDLIQYTLDFNEPTTQRYPTSAKYLQI